MKSKENKNEIVIKIYDNENYQDVIDKVMELQKCVMNKLEENRNSIYILKKEKKDYEEIFLHKQKMLYSYVLLMVIN